MASNPSNNPPSSKVVSLPTTANPPNSSSSDLYRRGGEHLSARRSGGPGSFGAGATSRSSAGGLTAPRKNQPGPKGQHKNSRRFKLADEDAIAESAVMNSASSRKGQTSITHLMNFSLPPRPHRFPQPQYQRGYRRNPTWGLGSGYHSVDKARYVHANYRFVVDPRGEYYAQSIDADVYLDWSTILQILASPISQSAACPICLGEPVAPRMAKCGHIFCLTCMIRYMHAKDDNEVLNDKKPRWKKCPICEDSIYISEVRPVRWYVGQEAPSPPREGEDIVLRLVMRPAGSTLALPKEGYSMLKEEDVPWHNAADVMDYARVMKGTEDYMIEQFDEEIKNIEEAGKIDELMYGDDTEWTSRAIRAVNDAKAKTKGLGNAPNVSSKPDEASLKKGQSNPVDERENGSDVQEAVIPDSWDEEHSNNTSETISSPDRAQSALSVSLAAFKAKQGHTQPAADYYFYQALVHYYLSPLDIRILKAAFGDFRLFPSTILPRIERVSTGHVVDDELRRRTKYLSHLPYGCEVSFLECDWTDTVSPNILERFKSDIERRKKRNTEKATLEEKERVRAEKEEEDRRYAQFRRKRPNSPGKEFEPDEFQPLVAAEVAESADGLDTTTDSASPGWGSRGQNGSSFASLASPSTSPTASRTVWGTAAIAATSPPLLAEEPVPTLDDGWLQGWERDLLREDDLVAQVEAASLAEPSAKAITSTTGGKKKKGKKITLMSTNARRGA